MNPWDIILAAVIVLVIALAIWKMIKTRKTGSGCHGCSGNCCDCAGSAAGGCNKKDESK